VNDNFRLAANRLTKAFLAQWRLTLRKLGRAGSHRKHYFDAEAATSFWKPATAGKLRLRLGNLDKFTAGGLLVFGTAGLCVTAQTLDPTGAAQA
jgi:hypothetical protein